ncbi:anti-sigma factor [Hydrogenophaga sp.]|uniref:anti-sigma factor n=1 Tax=Hydrogenophaga sp. TaxID=1904254 RepID=UPI0019893541|nr:anti-sigma factor [Hydrogenophaga sp.]MBD3892864.1 anti-sigma factor [Hydrogenophaga sp.]
MTSIQPTSVTPDRRVSYWWRLLSVFLLIVVLLGWAAAASMHEQLKAQIGHLQERLVHVPQVRHVAVLLDAKQLPALLVTMDPKSGVLQLQRLNAVAEGPQDSMQLWALRDGQPPRSLGVITSKHKTLQLPAQEAALAGATQLAISVEDKGGVAEQQGPRLPYLFQGWLVQKAI